MMVKHGHQTAESRQTMIITPQITNKNYQPQQLTSHISQQNTSFLQKEKEFPTWIEHQTYESWIAEYNSYIKQIKEDRNLGVIDEKMEEEVRTKLVRMLGKDSNTNQRVRKYYQKWIMNSETIRPSLEKIMDKLKQSFKVTSDMENKKITEEVNNFRIGNTTAETIDKIDYLRTKVGKSLQRGTE